MMLQEQIKADMITAMKAKNSDTVTTLRGLISAIKNAIIDHDGDFSDTDVEHVVVRMVKQLKDARNDFAAGGRDDLVEQNNTEIALLEVYLPTQMSDTDLDDIIAETIEQTGMNTKADMGKLMGAVMGKVQGKADGNRVKDAVMVQLS